MKTVKNMTNAGRVFCYDISETRPAIVGGDKGARVFSLCSGPKSGPIVIVMRRQVTVTLTPAPFLFLPLEGWTSYAAGHTGISNAD